mgnify:CR=1 FL=1|jgi:hypothetical protein
MIVKRLLCPERARRIPEQFSWVDHRLVREHRFKDCGPEAMALYLLLITVGDAEGLSYYSDTALARLMRVDEAGVRKARHDLLGADLIAYRKPLYQVLSLEHPVSMALTPQRGNRCISIGEILRTAAGGEA